MHKRVSVYLRNLFVLCYNEECILLSKYFVFKQKNNKKKAYLFDNAEQEWGFKLHGYNTMKI